MALEKKHTPTTSTVYRGPSNLMLILLVLVSFFAGYLFLKVKTLEQKNLLPSNAQNNNQQKQEAESDSPLSTENLLKYAKDLKLDSDKFNSCLNQNKKADVVNADIKQATGLGIQGTPGFLINGKLLGGAFPFQYFKEIIDKEIQGQGSTSCKDYSEDLQKYCDESGTKSFNPTVKNIDLSSSQIRGSSNAKVTVVEFSDFQCPYCIRAFPTVKQILEAYPNDVQLYYKNLPLVSIHPLAQKAAEASLCAKDQGKYWEYHDKLFEVQTSQ